VSAPNVAEMVAIYQHIKAHPETWKQDVYAERIDCGTAYCVAGWAVTRAGDELVWPEGAKLAQFVVVGSGHEKIKVRAAHLLGLTEDQADDLFDAVNDLYDIREIITDITGVDPEQPSAVTS
jgi:hypothetical protein